jgi:hypothetical protein
MAKKSDNAEIENRINQVYSLILACQPYAKIVRYASEKWGITSRQTDTLIQRARNRMKEISAIHREEAYAEELELRREIIRKALDDKKYQTALQAADSRAKLRGLFITLEQAIGVVTAHGYGLSDATITTSEGEGEPIGAFADILREDPDRVAPITATDQQ